MEQVRTSYRPELPSILVEGLARADFRELEPSGAERDAAELGRRFPRTYGCPVLELIPGQGAGGVPPLAAGVVLSGGQAPGGHNVIAGLFDGLKALHGGSRLFGFLGGPKGIFAERFRELTAEGLEPFRNTGGFDLVGSGRDKIETSEQFAACRSTCEKLGLDGLVIVGGDDSNTNAALLAEYFLEHDVRTSVIGVPKTIDGDLKGGEVELPFGFDTATKVYSELIGNICRDAASAGKYWHFIRLMGRSASHVTLECALETQVNLALVAEEVQRERQSLAQVVETVADVVRRRAEVGKHYGVLLVPEGLIEFIPEVRGLIAELNTILSEHEKTFEDIELFEDQQQFVGGKLSRGSAAVFEGLPVRIRQQLLIDRDAHGNVQVSKIDTEQLLIEQVTRRIADWRDAGKFRGRFQVMGHFFGYEGRCAAPSNFDAGYTQALGRLAALLAARGKTGYLCSVRNLAAAPGRWRPRAAPLTAMMEMETRQGKPTPVIAKALVQLGGAPFRTFAETRFRREMEDDYVYPGPIQYFGPPQISSARCATLLLEHPVEVQERGA